MFGPVNLRHDIAHGAKSICESELAGLGDGNQGWAAPGAGAEPLTAS